MSPLTPQPRSRKHIRMSVFVVSSVIVGSLRLSLVVVES